MASIKLFRLCLITLALFIPTEVMAEETAKISGGDTAWIIVATALVLLMTIPGLRCLMEDLFARRRSYRY